MSFGSSKKPEVVKPAPVDNSEALEAAARLEAERLRKRKGMKSTMLVDDDMSGAQQSAKATLLGG
jgi:hypothetical protein